MSSVKKFSIIFFILFLIYTAIWFVAANVAEKKIHSSIEDLKSSGVIKSYSGDIDITGYPFKFIINLDYPNLQCSPQSHVADYNMLYDGNIKIILGLFSNSIKLKTNGTLHLKGHINHDNFHIVSSGDDNNYTVELQDFLLSPTLISNIIATDKPTKDWFFDVIKSIHLHAHNLKLINKINNELVASIEDTDITLNTKHSSGYYIDYKEKDTNAEFGKEAMILWNSFKNIPQIKDIINQIPYNVRTYFAVFKLNELGVINYDAKINIAIEDQSIEVYIDKFVLKDAIEDISIEGKIEQNQTKTLVNISSRMNFEEKWYHLMKQYARSADFADINIQFFSKTNKNSIVSSIIRPVDQFLNSIFSKKQEDVKSSYVPKLHNMGEIQFKTKTQYTAKDNSDFDLEIDNFDLATDDFKIKALGSFRNEDNLDHYKLELNLQNYPTLIDIVSKYVNRIVHATNSSFLISGKHFEITDQTSIKIKSLICKISEDPEKSRINAKIKAKKEQSEKYPAIGRYSSTQFESVWNHFILQLVAEKLQNAIGDFVSGKLDHSEAISNATKKITDTVNGLFQNVLQ